MKKYLIAISAALAILLAGCGEESSQGIDNKPNNIDVQENPKVEEQPVVETPKEQRVEEQPVVETPKEQKVEEQPVVETPKEQKVEEKEKESVTTSLEIEDY